jgi:predicted dithiol-disulfide oxidoreductase (DUF899 family)
MSHSEIQRYPANASPEYIEARNNLLQVEWGLRDKIEQVALLRRNLPPGAVMKDYTFKEGPADISRTGPIRSTTLADIAADGRSVVVYHLMFGEAAEEPCPMCSMAIDGFEGVAKHLDQHINFVIIAKGPIDRLRAYAKKRGWNNLRFLSSLDSTFNADMHLEKPAWAPYFDQAPATSVFKRDADGKVRHVYTASSHFDRNTVRGTDLMSPVWSILDLTPEGRGDWNASNEYML